MNDDEDEDEDDLEDDPSYDDLVEQRDRIETELEQMRKRIEQEVAIVPRTQRSPEPIKDAQDAFLFGEK